MAATVLSLMVLAALILIGSAIAMWRRGQRGRQFWLMLVLATVIAVNIALLTIPGSDGAAPMNAAPADG